MNPRKEKVEDVFKYKEARASYFAFGIVSALIGAFVIGTVVVRAADDVLAPPTALFPDQGELPNLGGGGGAGNLLDALKGGSLAKWGEFKADTVIGGRLGLGQIQGTVGAGTLRMAYPLDIQIVHNSSEDPTPDPANAYLNKNDTAVLRIASLGNSPAGRLWTGVQLARINSTSDATQADPAFTEKWFIGMNGDNDHLIIRANGSSTDTSKQVNIVDIDPDKGAACIGAMYVGRTSGRTFDGATGGYKGANNACDSYKDRNDTNIQNSSAHICTTEEIFRTITCGPIPTSGTGWINKGASGYSLVNSNDCQGWIDNSSANNGAYWTFSSDGKGGKAQLSGCNNKKLFLCCK